MNAGWTLAVFLAIPASSAAAQFHLPLRPVARDLTTTAAVYPFGDCHGLAADSMESRLYLGEGASVTVIDAALMWDGDPDPVVERIPVDATIISMWVDEAADADPEGDFLFVAGGTFGLVKVALVPPAFPPTPRIVTLDDFADPVALQLPNEKWCFDLAPLQPPGGEALRLVALFSARGASELRVYDLDALRASNGPVAPESVLALPSGPSAAAFAYALDVTGALAYVALGTGGLARVDLTDPEAPIVELGPSFDRSSPQAGCALPCGEATYESFGRVRDLSIAGGFLECAVDDWGVVEVDIDTEPWGTSTPVTCYGLESTCTTAGGSIYCCRGYAHQISAYLDASGDRWVAVGAEGAPVVISEAGPYVPYGRMGWELSPGGVLSESEAPTFGVDALFWFAAAGAAPLAQVGGATETDARRWRELVLTSNLHVFEQRIVWPTIVPGDPTPATRPAALIARDFGPGLEVARYSGEGKSPFGGAFSLADPATLLMPQEGPLGSDHAGFLRVYGRRIDVVPGTQDLNVNNLGIVAFDAQWPIDTAEFFVQPHRFGWLLRYFDAALATSVTWWQMPAPPEPADACSVPGGCPLKGELYLGSQIDPRALLAVPTSETMLFTRSFCRYGALLYDRADVLAAATAKWTLACDCRRCQPCDPSDASTCYEVPHSPGPIDPQCWNPDPPATSQNDCALIEVAGCAIEYPAGYAGQPLHLDTHPEMETYCGIDTNGDGDVSCQEKKKYYRGVRTWRSKIALVPSTGTYIAAIAAGHNANPLDANFERSMLVLYDVTDATGAPYAAPPGPWVAHGPDYLDEAGSLVSHGEAVAVDVATLGANTYAFVADFGGRVVIYDVTDPAAPAFAGQWVVPLDTFDGHHQNVSDVAVDAGDATGPYLYASAFRYGFARLRLEVGALGDIDITEVKRVDTPGLAHGLRLRVVPGGGLLPKRTLLVSDKGGGVRLHGQL